MRPLKLNAPLPIYSDLASLLSTALERLLSAPHSHFLPPKLQVATSRLLLAITLDPAFFAAHPSSAQVSSEFPATSASKGIDIAKQSDRFRQGCLRCLKAALDGAGGTEGLVDRAAEVWRRGASDSDQVVSFSLCLRFPEVGRSKELISRNNQKKKKNVDQIHLDDLSQTLFGPHSSCVASSSSEFDVRATSTRKAGRTSRGRNCHQRRGARVPLQGDFDPSRWSNYGN